MAVLAYKNNSGTSLVEQLQTDSAWGHLGRMLYNLKVEVSEDDVDGTLELAFDEAKSAAVQAILVGVGEGTYGKELQEFWSGLQPLPARP